MTRRIVYSVALGVFVCTTILTLTSLLTTHWVTYSVTASTGATFTKRLGLYESCSSVADPSCRPFPSDDDCRAGSGSGSGNNGIGSRAFCSLWRTGGFLLALATIVELAILVSFLVVLAGGKPKREGGWRLVGALLLADAVIEFTGMGIVAWLFEHDSQFVVPGWSLDYSFYLCTASGSVSVLLAAALAASAYLLPPEDDYESLEDPLDS
ncbi:putative lysine-sensitive aspartokinase 3 protein [Rosellinia necatrix]|uniref:Putative lysine-sensitive aspartokinase 3 protein n=1 Tax=Rosellinia necatrix TaxID=77044 RepID=A0A1W2TCY2_ROSNE|nr:putative lysine-sensitive aspartokinase 3 protein [Rosellinia necatrix]